MLLLIPSIEIRNRKCVLRVQSAGEDVCTDDPIEAAKLWRIENAKALYVRDIDGAVEGHMVNFDIIKTMVETVDVPILLAGGMRTYEEVQAAMSIGIYRAIIATMLVENPADAKRCLEAYGANKIVIGIDACDGLVEIRGRSEHSGLTAVRLALTAKELGFKRIMYTDILLDGTMRGPNFAAIRTLAEAVGMRITFAGGVSGLDDLLKLQEMESLGLDSVVVGRALYENSFACQPLWRMAEMGNYPYTAKI